MINSVRALVTLAVGLVLLPWTAAQAQSCNPAVLVRFSSLESSPYHLKMSFYNYAIR